MVHGIDDFANYFKNYSDGYTIIGGCALNEVMEDAGMLPRVSKDLDIVLKTVLEATDGDSYGFIQQFEKYIEKCDYKNKERADGKLQFYRFTNPTDTTCPKQLELITVKKLGNDKLYTKIDNNSNLSAMMILEQEYFQLTKDYRITIREIPVLNHLGLIVLKAKAWVNLTETRAREPSSVHSDDIEKHMIDIKNLLTLVTPAHRISIPDNIRQDMIIFLGRCSKLGDQNIERFRLLCSL